MKAKPFNLFLLSFLLISCSSNSNNEASNSQVDNPQIEEAFEYYTELKEIYDTSIKNKEITLQSIQYHGWEEVDFKETKREIENLRFPNESTNIDNSLFYIYRTTSGTPHIYKFSKEFDDYLNSFFESANFIVDEINNDLGILSIYNQTLGVIDVYYDGKVGYTNNDIRYVSNEKLDTFNLYLEYIMILTTNIEYKFTLKDGIDFFYKLKSRNALLTCNNKGFEMQKIYELFLDNVELFSDTLTLYMNAPIPYSLEGIKIKNGEVENSKTIINKDGYIIEYRDEFMSYHSEMLQSYFKDQDQYAGTFILKNAHIFVVYPFKINIDKLIWIYK
ncbi:MAG: hypothetical protein K6E21_02255 [Bacilli bacterium]|nr:hypothetical protein [Bacilli bacterium]